MPAVESVFGRNISSAGVMPVPPCRAAASELTLADSTQRMPLPETCSSMMFTELPEIQPERLMISLTIDEMSGETSSSCMAVDAGIAHVTVDVVRVRDVMSKFDDDEYAAGEAESSPKMRTVTSFALSALTSSTSKTR